MAYDIIGDVHGQAEKLTRLLDKLGYRSDRGVYRHPAGRQAVFLGDLIDRGPGQLQVVNTVRAMVERGSAYCVMGNHEWNAIGYGTPRPDGRGFLRERTENKRRQHAAFLEAVGVDTLLHEETLDWFMTLPPVLELDGMRACHAWWNPESVDVLRSVSVANGALDRDFLLESFQKRGAAWEAMHKVTNGHEVELPDGKCFVDPNGVERREIRVRWWDVGATTYRAAALVPSGEREKIPDDGLPESVQLGTVGPIPTFIGHYWLSGVPQVLGPTMACLDYGAGKSGPLVAFRWNGEATLSDEGFVAVM